MIFGQVPGVGRPVARVVQGTAMIRADKEERAFALLDGVFEAGGTTLDTAHQYGDGERVFGRWVRERGARDDPTVPVGPVVETLNEHVEAGRIRAFGASNWSVGRIDEAGVHGESGDAPGAAGSRENGEAPETSAGDNAKSLAAVLARGPSRVAKRRT